MKKRGTWLRDEHQRYVLLRGVNLGPRAKKPPYLPVYPLALQGPAVDPAVLREEWARVHPRLTALVRELGLSCVRLLVTWKGVEPERSATPGQLSAAGEAYLDGVAFLLEGLGALGLRVFVDFHQDLAHELYGGEGFPDWALAVDAQHPRPERAPVLGDSWGLNYYELGLRFLAPVGPLVRHTLRSFWENRLTNEALRDYPVRDHFVATFAAAAGYLATRPAARAAVLGYEPFNEPPQVGLDDTAFEAQTLTSFYRDALRALRTVDATALLFAEPRVDWTVYELGGPEFQYFFHTNAPTTALGLTDFDDEGLVFSFHYYDPRLLELASSGLRWLDRLVGDPLPGRAQEWKHVFPRLRAAATSRGLVPFLSEFGASQAWEPPDFTTRLRPAAYQGSQAAASLGEQWERVEALCLNATYWNADFYNSREAGDGWNGEDFSLVGPDWEFRHVRLFARPYPQASSAQPREYRFEPETETFTLALEGAPVSEAPTIIFLPTLHHWHRGFTVLTTGTDTSVTFDAATGLLAWRLDRAQTEHHLRVQPAGEGAAAESGPGSLPTLTQRLSVPARGAHSAP